MREVKLYGAVLAALLFAAYLSWTRKEAPQDLEKATLLEVKAEAIQALDLYTKSTTVAFSRRQGEGGQSYPWFAVETQERARGFAGNDEVKKLLEGFGPFTAVRSLGKELSQRELEEIQLAKPQATLVITHGTTRKEFEVGGRTGGARDWYVRPKGGKEVFLVASRILGDLEFPESKYMQRRLRAELVKDVERLTLNGGGRSLVALQKNRESGPEAFWSTEAAPEERDETLGNFIDKLEKLSVAEYLEGDRLEDAVPILEVEWTGAAGKRLGSAKLYRRGEGKTADYLAVSSTTRVPVKVSRFTGEQLERDLPSVLSR